MIAPIVGLLLTCAIVLGHVLLGFTTFEVRNLLRNGHHGSGYSTYSEP